MIQAALNGGRSRSEHAAVPVAPAELAAEAARSVAAGAGSVHVHVRRPDGVESVAPGDVAAALGAIRGACPGTHVGVSTGAWIEPDPARRLALVTAWRVLPDFASVNFHEAGAEELAAALLSRGVGVEAGLASPAAAARFAAFAWAGEALRLLVEPPEEDAAVAEASVAAIARATAELPSLPRLVHGFGRAAWPVLEAALARGEDTRIGFEDTLVLPDGRVAASNADLVAAAVAIGHRLAGRGA